MPLYEYQCINCENNFDKMVPLKDWNIVPPCPECGGVAMKIMVLGGIQDQHPVWLDNSIRNQIQDLECERPIETRTEYNKYLKDNGIIPTN